jgi:hypothetical protein
MNFREVPMAKKSVSKKVSTKSTKKNTTAKHRAAIPKKKAAAKKAPAKKVQPLSKRNATKKTSKKSVPKKRVPLKFEICHNCLEAIDPQLGHVCVPVTERQLFSRFDEDLRDAFQLIRERASELGEQRIYNNARAVMFAQRVCYLFVRPKKSFLEVCFFLPREVKTEQIHQVKAVSKAKYAHTLRIIHADQVDESLLEWLSEAFEYAR